MTHEQPPPRPPGSETGEFQPAQRHLLVDEVTEKVREAILNGVLPPGGRLLEVNLAGRLRVSRGPIRDALTRLEREGLVVKLPNRATQVARLTPGDAEEVFSLRLALERLAIARVIARASDEAIAQIQQVVHQIDAAVAAGVSPSRAALLDMQFHEALLELAEHRRLLEAWNNLKSQILVLLLSRNAVNRDFCQTTVGSHQAVVNVILRRDLPAALHLIEEHIWGSYVYVLPEQARPDR